MFVILLFIILAIFLESTVATFPLTLLILIYSSVMVRKNIMFSVAFFSGMLLDVLSFKTVGITSLYFTTVVFVVYLYEKKFELNTPHFIAGFSFISSFIYLLLNGVSYAFFQSAVAGLFAALSYLAWRARNKKVFSYR